MIDMNILHGNVPPIRNTVTHSCMHIADCTAPSKLLGTSPPKPLKTQQAAAAPGLPWTSAHAALKAQQAAPTPGTKPQHNHMLMFIDKMSLIIDNLKAKLATITRERDALQVDNLKYKEIAKSLRTEVAHFRNDCKHEVYKALAGHFTSTQIEALVTKMPVTSWKEEDISKALGLRSLSPKACHFIREKWKIPLPSSATISRWISKLAVEPGVLQPVMNLLQNKASTMAEKDRLCVISFD